MKLHRILRHGLFGGLLALAAASAHAQADYRLYGIADFSYGRFEPSGLYRVNRFNSNSLSPTFVGFNLKDSLDGGWTPGITLESFIRFQDFKGGRNDSDPFFSRNAFVSLGSDYGTLQLGRLQTSLFNATARFNAFGNSISFSPALRHVFASGNLDGVQGDFYWNRALSYQTPRLGGATFTAMHAEGPADQHRHFDSASLVYAQGLWAVSATAQQVKLNNGIDDPTSETAWQLGGSYNFGLVQAFAQYTGTRDRGLDVRSKIGSAGVKAALGPGNVLAQVAMTQTDGPAVDRKHTSTSLGYVYPYDSLTDLYLLGMDDRIKGQTRGVSVAGGVRLQF